MDDREKKLKKHKGQKIILSDGRTYILSSYPENRYENVLDDGNGDFYGICDDLYAIPIDNAY